jgi:beta-lactamase superfamily II metal-dependent hydrolase
MADISLEIHHLDVHGGDATVILVKDLEQDRDAGGKVICSVLIDAGAEQQGSAYLEAYLKSHLRTNFDYMIATHYHEDHIDGLSKENSIRFTRFIDNGGYRDGKSEENAPNGVGAKPTCGVYNDYKARIETHVTKHGAQRLKLPFVNSTASADKVPVEITLGNPNIKLVCYCANGILADGTNVLKPQADAKRMQINPNDLSLAVVLQWGDFRYLTAGDLSGDKDKKAYYDMESELVTYLRGEGIFHANAISVFKASHHGSEHSNQTGLLDLVKPRTVVVSVNQPKKVPAPIFLERLKTHYGGEGVNPEAKVVFSNRLTAFEGHPLHAPLKALQDANRIVPQNIRKEGERLHNSDVKCVVIRRRVKDGVAVAHDDVPLPGMEDEHPNVVGRLSFANDAYEVVMVKRDPDEASEIVKQAVPKSYLLQASWLARDCSAGDIAAGFNAQAAVIKTWYEKDHAAVRVTEGEEYVKTYFPAFAASWDEATDANDLVAKIRPKMTTMFGDAFTLKTSGYFGPAAEIKSSASEQQTLFYLLHHNSRQFKFNAVAYSDQEFDFWNEVVLEPHGTTTGVKRKPLQKRTSDRPRKKPKNKD